jgi:hypothetical protein
VTTRQAKVLTVSDGVIAGTREDRSGEALDVIGPVLDHALDLLAGGHPH